MLGGRAADILLALIEADGAVVDKDTLLRRAWAGRTVEDGARHIKLGPQLANAAKAHTPPPSGTFATIADLDGMVIAGPPEVIIDEIRKYEALGADIFVFDLRARGAEWRACLEEIGTSVLPALRSVA